MAREDGRRALQPRPPRPRQPGPVGGGPGRADGAAVRHRRCAPGLALRRAQPPRLHARSARRPRRGTAPNRRPPLPAPWRGGARDDRPGARVRRQRAARQRRLERLRAPARGAAWGGLRGGADRVPLPSRCDDRPTRGGDAGRRRPLQGLHPLPPRLGEAPRRPAARRAAAHLGAESARGRAPAGAGEDDPAPSLATARARRRVGGTKADARLPARWLGRLRGSARRPRRRGDLAAQRAPALGLRLPGRAGTRGRSGGTAAALTCASSAGGTSTTRCWPQTLPPAPRLPAPRRALVALAARARGLAGGQTGYPIVDAGMRQLARRGSCTTARGWRSPPS